VNPVNPGYDVAVIGAGCAGLSAGVRLAKSGARVLVLEARSRLGGRATAFADRETGELVDNGQHVLLGCYTDTFEFLREIDALENVTWQRALRVTMIDRLGGASRLECPDLPSPLHLIAGVFDWNALTWGDRLSILRMAGPLRAAQRELRPSRFGPATIASSPDETVENWLIRNGQTPRLQEMLWEPLALAALNQPPAHAAAPPFARVLAEMFGSNPKAAALVLPNKPLDVMYAEPARAYIERRGGAVLRGSPATVEIVDGAVRGVRAGRAGRAGEAGGDYWAVPAVISAVPWFALGGLFLDRPPSLDSILARAAAMASSPIVSVNLWLDQDVIDEPFVGLPGRAMQWVFNKGGGHISLVSSGAAPLVERTNAELIALAYEELASALPVPNVANVARRAQVLRASVVREPRATFSLAPGQPARPATATPVRGFYLAGDWTDTGLPATIEGAVRSGHRAANLIIESSSHSVIESRQ
jgi:squalene-associated FAD-dependent desaturase